MLVDGYKRGPRIDPRSRVVILDPVAHHRQRRVRMAAENTLALSGTRVANGSVRDLVGKPQPARTHAVKKTREALRPRIQLLYLIEQVLAHAADQQIPADEAVELMPVDSQVTLPVVLPHVALIHRHADQMRHQIRQAVIVVALNPNHFHVALGIREFADMSEKFPVLAGKPAEIQVRENISQQHQPLETMRLEHVQRVLRAAKLGPKMDVRQYECVVRCIDHALYMRHKRAMADDSNMKIRRKRRRR